jgi:hypothetical protein
MPILDKSNQFHNSAAITTAGRYAGTVIDLQKAGNALDGSELTVLVNVPVALAGGTNVTFSLETHTTNDFSAARTVLASSGAVVTASLVAGYRWQVKVPVGCLQYLALVATGVGTYSSGSIDAHLTPKAGYNNQ